MSDRPHDAKCAGATVPDDDGRRRFIELYARHQQRILGYIAVLVPRWQDAEDVFQRTSIVLWDKFAAYDPERDFLSWAYGIAFYEVQNFRRVAARRPLQFSDELITQLADDRAAQPKDSRRAQALQKCLKKLGNSDRQLVARAYEGSGTIKELANDMGRSVQTIYNRLNRVRRQLLDCIDHSLGQEDMT